MFFINYERRFGRDLTFVASDILSEQNDFGQAVVLICENSRTTTGEG